MIDVSAFLPVSKVDMENRGWDGYDFLVVTGDAYVDHPSFGAAVIARVLEAEGFKVAVLAQPDWHSAKAFKEMGKPRLGIMIGAGNLDSMVAHYTAARKKRSADFYSPGKQMGLRPDRATIVYANRAREAFPGVPIVIGGLEASLRRFAHYDYWEGKVRRPVIFDAQADLLVYGMGETATIKIANRLAAGIPVGEMKDIKGTAFVAESAEECVFPKVEVASFEQVRDDKRSYAEACKIEYDEHDPIRGKAILQRCGEKTLVVNPPAKPLSTVEFDRVSELPYTKEVHPMYDSMGGVPAIEEVRFSVIHNRGCFGACNFCALAFHQGRMITVRSHESVIKEVKKMTEHPLFKGYVNDVGGPTANFRHTSCKMQMKNGMCKNKNCLTPTPCKNLDADHSDYLKLLRELRAIPGVKKVFVRSGIRFDYLLEDKSGVFFSELVKYHISGQLKVAPEHCINSVLDYMGKPHNEVYNIFMDKYARLNQKHEKEQYLVPYLISSHPGSSLSDAVRLAEYLRKTGKRPEQVQDFYPTPGTISTCMYYTGIDPRNMKEVYVPWSFHEKAMQRSLLQWWLPQNRHLVLEALEKTGRRDLIGYGPNCLIRPDGPGKGKAPAASTRGKTQTKEAPKPAAKKAAKPERKKGWAKPTPKKNAKPKSGKKRQGR